MAYTPKTFTKVVRNPDTGLPETLSEIATTMADEVRLRFDGYVAGAGVALPLSNKERLTILEAEITVGPTAPASPQLNWIWVDTN